MITRAQALANERRYRKSAKGRYTQHKANARRREVPFLLTFEEWLGVWMASGHWCDSRTDYHMCRRDDDGPYAVGNVYIGSKAQNCAERNRVLARRRRA
jgi:hypothetical protein